ncbi:S41 family peptidase [Nakamurella sp. PAMC28650]|uniref:S41 family peptidase n=1 Tax=Nakamurella sp. PAMC28650 TaxID=2762325 RepID=UPI00164E2F11|nr:S41 family peptidase [Nakamurella sp. PAMC28650]QNK79472.1 hypothetical protein H7F38_14310 [Nakamurella sp. PAMC28650]
MSPPRFLTSGGAEPFTLLFAGPLASEHMELLKAERFEFEAVLGAPVVFADGATPQPGARWIIGLPSEGDRPSLAWDAATRTLTSFATTSQDFMDTLNALHTLAWCEKSSVTSAAAHTTAEAAQRITDEIANTYPSFELRGLNWQHITARHRPALAAAEPDSFAKLAATWVAELGDAHTAVHSTAARFSPPYRGVLTARGIALVTVPPDSAAASAGARPGWIIQVDDPQEFLRTTGASPQHHRQVAARRALAFTGAQRVFTAHSATGFSEITWTEVAAPPTLAATLHVTHEPRGDLTVALANFNGALDLTGAFDALFTGAATTNHLTLDLRGNTGGSLLVAGALRDRFLRTRTQLGSIRFTTGTGTLAAARPLYAEPSAAVRWPGRTTILVDEMTYSAAEDCVLGLQGLEHITILGPPTGGGSGRPRTIPLFDDLVLKISTALTYDRAGHCIEFNGLTTDGPINSRIAKVPPRST